MAEDYNPNAWTLFAPIYLGRVARIVSTVVKRAAFGAEQKTSRELRLYLWLRDIWGTHSWCFLQEETEVHLEGQHICSGFSRLPRWRTAAS